jgi:hypothetical protein
MRRSLRPRSRKAGSLPTLPAEAADSNVHGLTRTGRSSRAAGRTAHAPCSSRDSGVCETSSRVSRFPTQCGATEPRGSEGLANLAISFPRASCVVSKKTKPRLSGAFLKRMMGLEPTTFCMASARDVRTRSRPFAQTGLIPGSSSERANATEPERTTNLAILATPRSEAKRLRREDAGAGRWLRHRPDSSSGARLLWLAMLRTRR